MTPDGPAPWGEDVARGRPGPQPPWLPSLQVAHHVLDPGFSAGIPSEKPSWAQSEAWEDSPQYCAWRLFRERGFSSHTSGAALTEEPAGRPGRTPGRDPLCLPVPSSLRRPPGSHATRSRSKDARRPGSLEPAEQADPAGGPVGQDHSPAPAAAAAAQPPPTEEACSGVRSLPLPSGWPPGQASLLAFQGPPSGRRAFLRSFPCRRETPRVCCSDLGGDVTRADPTRCQVS